MSSDRHLRLIRGLRTRVRNFSGEFIVRWLVAAILLLSAVSKSVVYLKQPLPRSPWPLYHLINFIAIEMELSLCIWLLVGIRRRVVFRVAIVMFAVFMCVSLIKGIALEQSCGCFGNIETSPWLMAAIDAAVVLALILWTPRCSNKFTHSESMSPYKRVAIASGWFAITLLVMVLFYPVFSEGDIGSSFWNKDDAIILRPDGWVGRPLPIISSIHGVDNISHGRWSVLFYHRGCDLCSRAAHLLIDKLNTGALDGRGLVFIDLHSFRPSERQFDCFACQFGAMDVSRDWFVETPLLIELSDGVVTNVIQRDAIGVLPP